MDPNVPQGSNPEYLRLSFEEKWEFLQPVIRHLYVDENKKLPNIAKIMKDHYGFDAFPHQYKYQLKKWGITKSVPAVKKEVVVKILGKRMREDESATAAVRYKGKEVDKKKLRRYLKSKEKRKMAYG